MKVLLEQGVWLAMGEGDPPRTTVDDKAREFDFIQDAIKALLEARKYRPFKDAEIKGDLF